MPCLPVDMLNNLSILNATQIVSKVKNTCKLSRSMILCSKKRQLKDFIIRTLAPPNIARK